MLWMKHFMIATTEPPVSESCAWRNCCKEKLEQLLRCTCFGTQNCWKWMCCNSIRNACILWSGCLLSFSETRIEKAPAEGRRRRAFVAQPWMKCWSLSERHWNMLTWLSILFFRYWTLTHSEKWYLYTVAFNQKGHSIKHVTQPVIRQNWSRAPIWGCRALLNSLCHFPSPLGHKGSRSRCVELTDTLTTLPVFKFLYPLLPVLTKTTFDVHSTCVLTRSPTATSCSAHLCCLTCSDTVTKCTVTGMFPNSIIDNIMVIWKY